MEHTTLLYNYLFTTHTYHIFVFSFFFFFISNLHMSDLYTRLSVLHSVFAILYIAYLYIVVCVLSCCCHSVALWSFCRYKQIPRMCKQTWPIKLILILILILIQLDEGRINAYFPSHSSWKTLFSASPFQHFENALFFTHLKVHLSACAFLCL